VNTTDYPLLFGKMSVFMDNTFVTNSQLNKTNPKGELSLFLGPDPGIIVQFKERRFNETKGFIKKNNFEDFQHDISIKNNKSFDVDVAIFDQFPQSQDEKIKVNLIAPNLKEDKTVVLNKLNNLCWTVKIPSSESHQILFHYSIEYPKEKEIDFY